MPYPIDKCGNLCYSVYMAMDRFPNSVSWRIPRTLYNKLKNRQKKRQSLAGVVEDIMDENEELKGIHDPLIDKIAKMTNELDYYKYQGITPELLERLSVMRHPQQTVGGVLEELIETTDKVKRGEIHIYDKTPGKDM